ncbi:MAG: hypothetical protein HDR50_00285 [Desulfovibrio sp.]|uniref:hypothetical protein n=1 Tax=Desulfovibrio sp. TaxID=885 RepID=UPI001A78E069|nr:hypothetical protein [Desulfovibrio sp.]MBD5416131.1 hypothetical protein [Desulfovibrio sp.]
MLKRVAVFVALTLFISMASLTDAHAEARGPKIFGLQVGMPWEDAVQIVKQYANKNGLDIEVVNNNLSIAVGKLENKIIENKVVDKYIDSYIIISKTNLSGELFDFLAQIVLYPKAFNIKQMDKEKLEIICDRYGIEIDKMKNTRMGSMEYSNAREGYKVGIGFVGQIFLEATEKASDMILE